MWLKAIKNHSYRGRQIIAGKKYEVSDPGDARVLQAARLAVLTTAPDTIVKSVVKKVETREMRPESAPEPELESESEVEIEEDGEEKSPKDDEPKSRRGRRKYRRNDMVPEE